MSAHRLNYALSPPLPLDSPPLCLSVLLSLVTALSENRQAFKRIFLVPRMMRDVQDVDLTVEVFGQELSMPVFVSPAGEMTSEWE